MSLDRLMVALALCPRYLRESLVDELLALAVPIGDEEHADKYISKAIETFIELSLADRSGDAMEYIRVASLRARGAS